MFSWHHLPFWPLLLPPLAHFIRKVLPTRLSVSSYAPKDAALHFWCQSVDTSPPSPPNDKKQRAWDEPQIAASFQSLLDVSDSSKMRARLLAAIVKESGAWIQALPISAVGLHMTDDEVQTAATLRLGAPLCHPHNCKCNLCDCDVDQYATHGLSCQRSVGRHFRRSTINLTSYSTHLQQLTFHPGWNLHACRP